MWRILVIKLRDERSLVDLPGLIHIDREFVLYIGDCGRTILGFCLGKICLRRVRIRARGLLGRRLAVCESEYEQRYGQNSGNFRNFHNRKSHSEHLI